MPSSKHHHQFIESYDGIGAYGWDRKTNEGTIIYYLQKFTDDEVLTHLIPKLDDHEMDGIYRMITDLLKKHLTEEQYHQLFLKDHLST